MCFGCEIEKHNGPDIRIALDLRTRGTHKFRLSDYIAFCSHLPNTNNSLLEELKISINKACEQYQQLAISQWSQQEQASARMGVSNREPAKDRSQFAREMRIHQLFERLSTKQDGKCGYCHGALLPGRAVFDIPIPVAFAHHTSGANYRGLFYTLCERVGNLRLVCIRCNTFKGIPEIIGSRFFSYLARQIYLIGPLPGNNSLVKDCSFHPFYRPQPVSYAATRLCLLDDLPEATNYFARLPLRVFSGCRHRYCVRYMCYRSAVRTLEIGCHNCVPPELAFAVLTLKSPTTRTRYLDADFGDKIAKTLKDAT